MGGREVEWQLVSSNGRSSPSSVRLIKELVVFNSDHDVEEGEIPGVAVAMDEEFLDMLDDIVVANSLEVLVEQGGSIVGINKFQALVNIQEETEKESTIPFKGEEHLFTDHI